MIYFFLWGLVLVTHTLVGTTRFHIIVPTYNNEKWALKNIESITGQDYPRKLWRATIIVDAATDRTARVIEQYLHDHPDSDNVRLIVNSSRQGALANFYYAIHASEDDEVIVQVDGDDWLLRNDVLQILDKVYRLGDVWLTYGQFQFWPDGRKGFCKSYDKSCVVNKNYRRQQWLASHLRTFYAWLFKKIKREDLQYKGEFFDVTCDLAIMFPLLEMANGKYRCIPDILYSYNLSNPLSDYNIKAVRQRFFDHYLRNLRPYDVIREL